MKRFLKLTLAFIVSTLLICSTSLPSKKVVSYADLSAPTSAYITNYANFIPKNKSKNNKLVESVVRLSFEVKSPFYEGPVSSATGFSVMYDEKENRSYIVTNNHFCEDQEGSLFPSRFTYQAHDTKLSSDPPPTGSLVVEDTVPGKDLCLMSTSGFIKPVKIAKKGYLPKQMEEVITVGAPSGVWPIIIDTYITNLVDRDIMQPDMRDGMDFILLSSVGFGGQSGSPVFNLKGQVIGVVFLNISNGNGVPSYGTVAIHSDELRQFLHKNDIDL